MDATNDAGQAVANALGRARLAASTWRIVPIRERIAVIRRARSLIAGRAARFSALLGGLRPEADTLGSEVLPLLEAARFLGREAPSLLAPSLLGRRGRPAWLAGVRAEIRREPRGVILVLAPSNYPLFLPGVQMLQAIAAGNAVCAKPAPGGTEPLAALIDCLHEAGLPDGVALLLDEDAAIGAAATQAGFDLIVLTGSASTGRAVLRAASETLTPCIMELSGSDPVFVLPDAELGLVARCLSYALRLNAGATCIAPRRVFVTRDRVPALEAALTPLLHAIPPAQLSPVALARLDALLSDARAHGASVSAQPGPRGVPPIIVSNAVPQMALLQTEVMAPVLEIVPAGDMEEALRLAALCPFALGATIFGGEDRARTLAARIDAGCIVVNDVIVPTADPRLPFGGRSESGFGLTRGADGLLAMTVTKTVSIRHGRFRPHLDPLHPRDAPLLTGLISLLHGSAGQRFAGLRQVVQTLRRQPLLHGSSAREATTETLSTGERFGNLSERR